MKVQCLACGLPKANHDTGACALCGCTSNFVIRDPIELGTSKDWAEAFDKLRADQTTPATGFYITGVTKPTITLKKAKPDSDSR